MVLTDTRTFNFLGNIFSYTVFLKAVHEKWMQDFFQGSDIKLFVPQLFN